MRQGTKCSVYDVSINKSKTRSNYNLLQNIGNIERTGNKNPTKHKK
jgi:hypothetical protein